jgi:4-amino-4-deoxy-L-arabinose transferase-like glycosyltransferase
MVSQRAATTARSRFGLLFVLVVLLALVLREQFVLFGMVDTPIRGDVREYFAYAWNLVNHGVFSHAPPQAAIPLPDAYRSPGYPWLLALSLAAFPQDLSATSIGGWYPLALQMQVLLGTATVALVILLARTWLSGSWALVAGLLLAVWPHHIAATGALLSEVAFGFTLIAALYCFAKAWATDRLSWTVACGAAFGYAYLINPLIALFPPLLALVFWLRKRRTRAVWLLVVFMLAVALLAVRNARLAPLPDAPVGRGALNFVQGSWPNYHPAHARYYTGDPVAVAIMDEISRETQLLVASPVDGLSVIRKRLAQDPSGYLVWYAWEKPRLLWDWNIRLGFGGFYFQEVKRSPLDRPPLATLFAAMKAANPALTLIMLISAITLVGGGWKRIDAMPAAAVAALALYLTALHMVFQSEPRYANAYRGIEALMLATAMAWVASGLAARMRPKLQARR